MDTTLDKLNLDSVQNIDASSLPEYVEIDGFKVPRLKRKHVKKIQLVLAPFFSKSVDYSSAEILALMSDVDFEDLIISTALEIDIQTLDNMYDNTYKEIVELFAVLNPNFILGVAQEIITRAQLKTDATPSI